MDVERAARRRPCFAGLDRHAPGRNFASGGRLLKKALANVRRSTILVVDDETEFCRLLERSLGRTKWRVLSATDGRGALKMLKDGRIDLVILDIRLPDMDGIEILRRIRGERPNVPVLMLTAHGAMDTARRTMELGAYDYLTKPFDLPTLEKVIEEALRDIRCR